MVLSVLGGCIYIRGTWKSKMTRLEAYNTASSGRLFCAILKDTTCAYLNHGSLGGSVLEGKMYSVEVELEKVVIVRGRNELEVKTIKVLIVRVPIILYAYRYSITYSGM
jgi:hypothetical protein